MDQRLNKYISDSGFCSRREADRFIESGAVTINGRRAGLGDRVGGSDSVRVDGRLIKVERRLVYIALNKPRGIVSTTDPAERNNIADFVNYPIRIFNVGRLDKDSQGLILLTNDGSIVNRILRAANNHEKEYVVSVNKPITPDFLRRMSQGVPILGQVTKRCRVVGEGVSDFRIILTQGLNRQIRRMCEYLGYEVVRLKRVRIMNITLAGLPTGQWRELSESEISKLNNLIKDSDGSPAGSPTTAEKRGAEGKRAKSRDEVGANRKSESTKSRARGAAKGGEPHRATSKSKPRSKSSHKPEGVKRKRVNR